jgi:cytochrome c-type biogenesis protein CcmH/NrfG
MAFFNLGRIFADQGQDEKALENYRQALRLAPTQFEIQLQLGKILERQNHFAEGKKHFEVAMKLKPESAEARWALARSLRTAKQKIDSTTLGIIVEADKACFAHLSEVELGSRAGRL